MLSTICLVYFVYQYSLQIKINLIIVAKDINYMKTDFLINFLKKLHPPTINLYFYQYFLQTGCLLRICLSFINNFYYSI